MILKYRTSSLSNPPQTNWNYIDNITHLTSSYDPLDSTLSITLSTQFSSSPTIIILKDLAFLLTDQGKLLDRIYNPYSKYKPKYSNNPNHVSINHNHNDEA